MPKDKEKSEAGSKERLSEPLDKAILQLMRAEVLLKDMGFFRCPTCEMYYRDQTMAPSIRRQLSFIKQCAVCRNPTGSYFDCDIPVDDVHVSEDFIAGMGAGVAWYQGQIDCVHSEPSKGDITRAFFKARRGEVT